MPLGLILVFGFVMIVIIMVIASNISRRTHVSHSPQHQVTSDAPITGSNAKNNAPCSSSSNSSYYGDSGSSSGGDGGCV
ncbi:hypothetical protein RYX56_08285 [Alkalihalophilus lindianensis]|uniref:Uncharacterized protein n=1 Tax=Alkalihalophilus lindianensis TaxID=1630542 RepID=A0ABU3X8Z8_9BACI|nr:hypothetical protein [Alkalihalophilus lindianensis]